MLKKHFPRDLINTTWKILVPSNNKANRHNTTEILLNVALSNITLTLTIVRSHKIQWPNRKKVRQTMINNTLYKQIEKY
jgi:hypothetical protein